MNRFRSLLCTWIAVLATPAVSLAQDFEFQPTAFPLTSEGRALALPWNGGLNSVSVTSGDLDGDGDADLLLIGDGEGRLQFYRNDGGGGDGQFFLEDPFVSGLQLPIPNNNRLDLHDYDDDGDLDLFVGQGRTGQIHHYENTGGPNSPDFELVTESLGGIDAGFQASVESGDLDGDGEPDLLVGAFDPGILHFRRDATDPSGFVFVDTLRDADGAILSLGSDYAVPTLADLDADGDLDMIVGTSGTGFSFFRNTGNASEPEFTAGDDVTPENVNRFFLTPELVDIDEDGDLDLFSGDNGGFVSYYRNDGDAATPELNLHSAKIQLDFLDLDDYGQPSFADVDADGDLDLFVAGTFGHLNFLENVGTATDPSFELSPEPFAGIVGGVEKRAAWGDLDADGDYDLILAERFSGPRLLNYFENTGTAAEARFDSLGPLTDAQGSQILETRPKLVDLDGDGDLDLFATHHVVVGQFEVTPIFTYENVGTPSSPSFVLLPDTLRDDTGAAIVHSDGYHEFADFDADGDYDLFVGTADGRVAHYENTSTPGTGLSAAVFTLQTERFADVLTAQGSRNLPTFADIDGDGDLDLFAGRFQGGIMVFRNVGETTASEDFAPPDVLGFVLEQNHPNPASHVTTISYRLTVREDASLEVFDVLGRRVRVLPLQSSSSGTMEHVDVNVAELTPGTYFYRLTGAGASVTRSMLVVP